jgi:hypothetical protein
MTALRKIIARMKRSSSECLLSELKDEEGKEDVMSIHKTEQ